MRNTVKKVLESAGIEVRLSKNVAASIQREKKALYKQKWKLLERYSPRCILDLGANEGQSAVLFRELFPNVTVYSFEPIMDCFETVDRFLKDHGPGQAFQFALGESNHSTTIFRSEFTPSSSLLPMSDLHKAEFPKTAESVSEQIQVRRLDDVVSELDLPLPMLIKVDVQGYEGPLIEGGIETIRRSSALVVELTSYPLYESQSTFEEIHQRLFELGFVFRGVVDQMHSPLDGRILQYDALFENLSLSAP